MPYSSQAVTGRHWHTQSGYEAPSLSSREPHGAGPAISSAHRNPELQGQSGCPRAPNNEEQLGTKQTPEPRPLPTGSPFYGLGCGSAEGLHERLQSEKARLLHQATRGTLHEGELSHPCFPKRKTKRSLPQGLEDHPSLPTLC